MTIKHFILSTAALLFASFAYTQERRDPDGTYLFAQKDGEDLFLDLYEPASGSETTIDGIEKPTVIFVFGGGFKSGSRDNGTAVKWFQMLNDDGFKVISIDYRLGLRDAKKMGLFQTGKLNDAIHLAVEDLYSATAFIIENSEFLGVDPDNIVISGSSAGAITVLQGAWELANREGASSVLPEGFNYKGVLAYSGAVFSKKGTPKYKDEPAPTFFVHGTADKLVPYRQIWFFNLRFAGSSVLAKAFKKGEYNYNILRCKDLGHGVCESMAYTYEDMMIFLDHNVMHGTKRIVDASLDDPDIHIPDWAKGLNSKDLYK